MHDVWSQALSINCRSFGDKSFKNPSVGQAGTRADWQAGPGAGRRVAGPGCMLENFRAYQTSIKFYHGCEQVRCAKHLREQLLRAASSISLNLSEGSSPPTAANRIRYYHIALGSVRECQTILDLAKVPKTTEIAKIVDQLAGQTYKLCRQKP